MMARTKLTIEVKLNDNLIELLADLITDLNEIAELIPEWNNIEANTLFESISIKCGKLLDYKRENRSK